MARSMAAACLALATLVALAAAAERPLMVRLEHEAGPVPSGWTSSGPAAPEETIELTFAVKQRGLQELHDTLMRVSRPSSPDYGRHLSNEDVNALTAPAPEHIAAVERFVRLHGAEPVAATPNSDFIMARVSVATAERMLATEYVRLAHNASGVEIRRTPGGYSLPLDVAPAVDFVAPTVHVPGVRRPQQLLQEGAARDDSSFNTPKNLRQLYSIGDVEGKVPGNRQAVTAFLEQFYDLDSVQQFWGQFCDSIKCGKGFPKLIGDATTGSPGTESMLDIETITGVAGNVESEFWGFSGRSADNPQNEPFLKWLTTLSSTGDAEVPKLFSTSYGEDESSWSYVAAQRLNVEFQKAGVRGISLLYASGDEGSNCHGGRFVPEGPGSSPYVTAVGGTAPTGSWPAPGSETAIGLSSGGFSNYWPMPDYQREAVAQYLKQDKLPPTTRGYNTSGRAYPDISAQATNFYVIAGGAEPGVAGTSCAAPTAGGIFALLNDLRLQQGKSTLGFLNPLIYEHASAFNDVTTGSSSGCFLSSGWPARPGWDAVTGVGTPNYAKLAEVVSSLPAGSAAAADVGILAI